MGSFGLVISSRGARVHELAQVLVAAADGLGAAVSLGLGVGGLGEAFDGGEPSIPLAGDGGHGLGGLVEPVGVHAEEDLASLLPPADQPGVLERRGAWTRLGG